MPVLESTIRIQAKSTPTLSEAFAGLKHDLSEDLAKQDKKELARDHCRPLAEHCHCSDSGTDIRCNYPRVGLS